MKKYMSAVLTLLVIKVCAVGAIQTAGFSVERLSPKGRVAYQKLSSASIFRVGGIGDTGHISEEEVALRDLLEEPGAVEALESLVSSGSHEGGLYGLLGLSVKGGGAFKLAVEIYNSREGPSLRTLSSPPEAEGLRVPEGQVLTQDGCLIMARSISEIVKDIQSGHYNKALRQRKKS